MSKIIPISITTTEQAVTLDATYQFAWLWNSGENDCLFSNHSGIVQGDDDVTLVAAGDVRMISTAGRKVYIKTVDGTSTGEIHAQNFAASPFKRKAKGGESITVTALNVTENDTYTAPSGTAYSPVMVSVSPNVGAKSITDNGTYNASAESLDGYSSVTVNVTHPQYVDGGSIISLYNDSGQSVYGFTKTAEIDGVSQLQTVANEACTFECCCNFEPVGSDGRLWEIGKYINAGTCLGYWTENGRIYADIALHENWYDSDINLDNYIGHRTTLSLVVGDSYTKLYINGTLIADDIPRSKADLVSNDTDTLYLMHGYYSDRTADGNLYSFRMYHKELTASEIQQNYLADVYNFPNG